jgi:hypothetical protein
MDNRPLMAIDGMSVTGTPRFERGSMEYAAVPSSGPMWGDVDERVCVFGRGIALIVHGARPLTGPPGIGKAER